MTSGRSIASRWSPDLAVVVINKNASGVADTLKPRHEGVSIEAAAHPQSLLSAY
jgi:hypothetical protein